MKLVCKKGERIFSPQILTNLKYPYFKPYIEFEFMLSPEWANGDFCTVHGGGVRMPKIGKSMYHRGGINAAFVYDNGKFRIWPRYYEGITYKEWKEGKKKLHSLVEHTKIIEHSTWYKLAYGLEEKGGLLWEFNNEDWAYIPYLEPNKRFKPNWFTFPTVGTSIGPVVATKNLQFNIKFK